MASEKLDTNQKAQQHQPRCHPLRHVRRNRRGTGSRPLVLPGGRRRRHGGQNHLRLRHGRQRRHLRADGLLRQPASSARHARLRIRPAAGAAGQDARRQDGVLCVRQHRGHAPRGRAGLAGDSVPGGVGLGPVRDHYPRPDARQGKRPAAGGAGGYRREPGLWRLLPASSAGGAHPVAAGRPDAGNAWRWT